MSCRNASMPRRSSGFTLVEVIVVIALVGIIAAFAFTYFNTSFNQYLSLQAQGTSFTDLATQTQRIANVLRGLTDINSASADDIDCYAYFSPNDAYVSRIHYYKSADKTQLLADVTPMTANPPTGTLITSEEHTYTIIDNFHDVGGIQTFTYLDASGNEIPLPIADLRTVKNIKVTLATSGSNLSKNSTQTMTLQVSLRNRKTNL